MKYIHTLGFTSLKSKYINRNIAKISKGGLYPIKKGRVILRAVLKVSSVRMYNTK